jgi:hypothetical protein
MAQTLYRHDDYQQAQDYEREARLGRDDERERTYTPRSLTSEDRAERVRLLLGLAFVAEKNGGAK